MKVKYFRFEDSKTLEAYQRDVELKKEAYKKVYLFAKTYGSESWYEKELLGKISIGGLPKISDEFSKFWKKDKRNSEMFVPNKKTKEGKSISKELESLGIPSEDNVEERLGLGLCFDGNYCYSHSFFGNNEAVCGVVGYVGENPEFPKDAEFTEITLSEMETFLKTKCTPFSLDKLKKELEKETLKNKGDQNEI